jgi:hypothetical protein
VYHIVRKNNEGGIKAHRKARWNASPRP